ncbi:hypothetical protein U9M48_015650 [Paspalum notatum var. saurae]|uniref:Uncharacterized protein n=1 Tax=Paspalum notatum var. saurae TaxID=547442 RepID=A0AAQ3T4V3_PASNO
MRKQRQQAPVQLRAPPPLTSRLPANFSNSERSGQQRTDAFLLQAPPLLQLRPSDLVLRAPPCYGVSSRATSGSKSRHAALAITDSTPGPCFVCRHAVPARQPRTAWMRCPASSSHGAPGLLIFLDTTTGHHGARLPALCCKTTPAWCLTNCPGHEQQQSGLFTRRSARLRLDTALARSGIDPRPSQALGENLDLVSYDAGL